MPGTSPKADLYQQITDHIVAAIETAGEFRLPWVRSGARPVNVASKNPYNGVNILSLWMAVLAKDYPSSIWGTYKQWLSMGAQVRRGEKSSLVVFYQKIAAKDDTDERLVARASWVFNAAQVDGFQAPALPAPFDPIPRAEAFAAATGARIEEGGDRAYAMEELVAELGAAFLCADLSLTPEPREDHAAYVRSWLVVLKGDKKAIFTAASKASQAAGWLVGREALALTNVAA